MYTAFVLTPETREALLEIYPPKYDKVVAEHITVEFGVPEVAELPEGEWFKVIGEADSTDGLQALVVSVDGAYNRPDGKVYHITWSLDPDKYKPADSNGLIADYSNRWKLGLGVTFDAEPAILK